MKISSKLTKDKRRALKELKKLRVHEFDNGCGFAVERMIPLKKNQKNS